MKARLTIAAAYAARIHPETRAVLAGARSEFCEQSCYATRAGDPSLCDDRGCWARSVSARSPIVCSPSRIYEQRRLEVERGRAPAPRPRSLATLAHDDYNQPGGPR